MPEFATTVTPQVYTDESTGQLIYDSANATVETSAGKEQAHQEFAELQKQDIVAEEQGETLASQSMSEADAEYIINAVGGQEAHAQMLQWASENMSEEYIEYFDEVMSTGNITDINDATKDLFEYYQNQQEEGEYSEAFMEWVYSEVATPEQMEQVVGFMEETLTPAELNTVAALIEQGETQKWAELITTVINTQGF